MPWNNLIKQYVSEEENLRGVTRKISYGQAIGEAFELALEYDPDFFIMGQNVNYPGRAAYGTMKGLAEKYGGCRVMDTPISEDSLTGVAVGAALRGKRPLYYHDRPDYFLLGMSQIANQAAKWRFMSGGRHQVPLVMWAPITRGGGAGAQHTQAPQAIFAHFPGLKVVMPSNPYDTKGLLLASIADNNPVIYIEHRLLFECEGIVPKGLYFVPLGKGAKRRLGRDITIVGMSQVMEEIERAADDLAAAGIEAEVIDLRTIRPLDEDLILESVAKTGHLLVVDMGWSSFGVAAEVAALVAEKGFHYLKAAVSRIGLPDYPTPAGKTLEDNYYLTKDDIKNRVIQMLQTAVRGYI